MKKCLVALSGFCAGVVFLVACGGGRSGIQQGLAQAISTAKEIFFDGSTSGSSAENVQEALDELYAMQGKIVEGTWKVVPVDGDLVEDPEGVRANAPTITIENGEFTGDGLSTFFSPGDNFTDAKYTSVARGVYILTAKQVDSTGHAYPFIEWTIEVVVKDADTMLVRKLFGVGGYPHSLLLVKS